MRYWWVKNCWFKLFLSLLVSAQSSRGYLQPLLQWCRTIKVSVVFPVNLWRFPMSYLTSDVSKCRNHLSHYASISPKDTNKKAIPLLTPPSFPLEWSLCLASISLLHQIKKSLLLSMLEIDDIMLNERIVLNFHHMQHKLPRHRIFCRLGKINKMCYAFIGQRLSTVGLDWNDIGGIVRHDWFFVEVKFYVKSESYFLRRYWFRFSRRWDIRYCRCWEA